MLGPTLYDSSSNTVTYDNSFYNILNDIDIKLGFDEKSKLLKFKELLYSIKENSIHQYDGDIVVSKLKYIFSNIGCLSFGYYEAKEFVFELEKILLNDNELKKVSSIELIRNNSINEIDILQCICVKSGSGFVYFILCPNLPINQIYSDDFSSLFNLGFKPKSDICGIRQYYVPNGSKNSSIYDFIQVQVQAKTKKLG